MRLNERALLGTFERPLFVLIELALGAALVIPLLCVAELRLGRGVSFLSPVRWMHLPLGVCRFRWQRRGRNGGSHPRLAASTTGIHCAALAVGARLLGYHRRRLLERALRLERGRLHVFTGRRHLPRFVGHPLRKLLGRFSFRVLATSHRRLRVFRPPAVCLLLGRLLLMGTRIWVRLCAHFRMVLYLRRRAPPPLVLLLQLAILRGCQEEGRRGVTDTL